VTSGTAIASVGTAFAALGVALSALSGFSSETRAEATVTDTHRVLSRLSAMALPGGELSLSQLGLYGDIVEKRVAPGFLEYEPAYALFSDGLEKRRFLRLPSGARIDNSDPDHFEFPVGAVLFKEFATAGRRIETRVIARTGRGRDDFFMGAFVWNDAESDARFVAEGQRNARGTEHDVPSATSCWACHGGEPGRVLGLSAVQTPDLPAGLFSAPLSRRYTPPGDANVRAALGYLHANCAHCHNPNGSARPDTDLDLRLSFADRTVEATAAYRTALGRPLQSYSKPALGLRVAAGKPEESALLFRMSESGAEGRMPPLGAETVDDVGVGVVRTWIESLGE
jgi:hypothetical protein